jgi:hypothetical protein
VVDLRREIKRTATHGYVPFMETKSGHGYFIFWHSAMILIWAFTAAMVVLEWAARDREEQDDE